MATTVSKQYKLATDNGMLSSQYSEQQFVELLQDKNRRKAYYDFVKKKNPDFYSNDFDTFSRNVDSMLANYTPPASTDKKQAASVSAASASAATQTEVQTTEVPTMPMDAAADSTDAAVAMLLESNRKQQERDKEERARINNAQLPMSDEDNKREERIRTIDNTLKQVGVERFAERQPIGDAREEVLQQQQQLEQERTALQGQRKSYMNEPETIEEARENWTTAWMENTEEGKQAKREADEGYQQAVDYLRNEFAKGKTHQDIVADVQNKYNSGALTYDEANAELNKRLNDAFIAENKETLEAEYQTLYGGLAQRAYKADNGWLKKQEERIQETAVADALSDGEEKLLSAWEKSVKPINTDSYAFIPAGSAGKRLPDEQQIPIELSAALQLYQQAEIRLNETKKGNEQVGDFTKETLRHFRNVLPSTLTLGISDVANANAQKNVLEKIANAGAYDNPESVLTENELVLYDAIVANIAAETVRAENTSHLAKAGQITADMIPFVMDIAIGKGLFSGMTKATQKGISRGIVRALGNGKWRGVLARQTGDLIGGLAESAAIAAISRSTYKHILEEEAKVDPTSLKLTDNGWQVGKIDTQTTGDAIWNGYRGNFREIFTETGGLTQFAAGFLKASPLGKLISKTPIGMLSRIMDNSVVGKLFKQTAYHGIAGEMSEEWENTFYEATEAFLKAPKGEKLDAFGKVYGEFVSPDTQVPMLISFSVPAILGGALTGTVHTGQILYHNAQYKQAYKNLRDTYMKYGATEEEFEDALNELRAARMNMNIEDYPQLIRGLATTLSGGSQEQAEEFAAALSAYTVADANLGAIQEKHAKKQRQVQQLIRDIQASEERITSNTHADSGMMYHVNVNGQPGYVVSGALELNTYDNADLPIAMNSDVVTVRMEDGSVKQIAANQLQLLEQPQAAEGAMAFERRRLTARMNNLDRFKVGDVIYMTENGQPIDGNSSRVVDVTDEGVVAEIIDPNGQPNTTVIPHEVAESGLSTSDELVEEGVESVVLEMNNGSLITMQKTTSGDWMQVAPKDDSMTLLSQEDLDRFIADGGAKIVNGEQAPSLDVASGNRVVSEEAGNNLSRTAQAIVAARNGDQEAQEKLSQYGIKWGHAGVYRYVGESEVEYLRNDANAKVMGKFDNGRVDVTGNGVSPTSATNADYQIEFKPSQDLYMGEELEGNRTRMKNEETEDGWLEGGYTLSDVAKIKKRNADGTYTVIYDAEQGGWIDETAPSKYPTTQEGKLDWGQMDVPTATEAAIEKFGDKNTAKEYAELQIAQAKKAVAAANKKKATSIDADEFVAQKNAIRQEQQAAQAELSKWENVLLGIANYKTAEEQAAAEQAAAQAATVRAQRKQTIEGVGGTNMAERLTASPRIDGNAGSITAADGTKIPGHYVLVSANALTPSHNPNANFAPSEGYPTVDGQSINDRDYQADQEEQAKVQQVAQTYDGRAITNMPIVSDEGLVYSGNGRTMAGQLAAANGTDGAYTEALLENATQFGFTAEQVESVPNARVVFMTDERLPYNTTTLALFNQTEQQTQSNTASAAANVRKLTPEAVGHIIAAVQEFDNVDAFFGDSRAPFELVNRLIADGIISERDKAAFVDNGRLTNTGKDRLTALLFGTAFDEKTIRLLGDNAKVRNSVMRALPQILENKGLDDFSLFEHINNAIAAIYDMDTNGVSFFEFTRQIDIEGKTASDKYTAFELLLVDEMVNGGVQAFRDVLSGYNARAKESAGGQLDMFTGEVLTTEELTKQILQEYEQRKANERGGAQPESAVAGTSESDGEKIDTQSVEQIKLTDGRVVTLSTITDKDFALLGDITPIQRSLIAVRANAVQNPELKLKTAGYCNTTRRLLFNELPSEKKDLPTLRDIYFRTQQEYVNTPNKTQEYRFAADEVLKEIRRRLAYVDPENYPPKQGSANVSRLNDAELAVAEAETDTNPTEAQKKAENYKQGHVTLWGLPFTIENPKGSVRRGTDANGKQWEQVMNNTYGKIRRTEGVDGDHIDVFFGPNLQSDKVFVVDQLNVDTKEFDEHKVMLGFDSMEEAQAAYLSNYEKGWQGMGPVTETTMDEFKKWIDSSHRKTKPFNEYKSVKKEGASSSVTNRETTERTPREEPAMRIAKAEADMQEFASKLGAQGVHLISDKEQLPKEEGAAYRAIRNGANVMGWYNPKTNQVYIYLPNANNLQEVYKTLLHEFVAHKGLRDMLGKEKFDQLCHKVWDMMSEQDKLQYALYVKNNTAVGSKAMQELMDGMTEEEKTALLSDTKLQLAAADEYMAHFAETGVSEQERSIWQRIVDAVRDLLRKAGINLRLTDADIARLLYESSSRLSNDMTMRERSQLIAKNNKVVENITTNAESMGLSTDTRFRITPEEDEAYLDAVNSGDMATAEQMLRDAAERAGYLPQADYQDAHGAPRASVEKEDFTNAEAMQEAADNGEDTNLWAVAQGISIQPDDYFSPQGPRWYGYSNQSGMESYAALSSAIRSINSQLNEYGEVKDMPIVKVYRTVPTDIVGEQLESEGQWVTPSLEYAIKHGENRFEGNYRIIDQEVPADQLWWDGMDVREWGFDDGTINVYQNTENNRKLFEVTYDDNGNVIPLSKRFDKSKEDTRFRIGTQVVPMGDNTLVGLHNLSATKLRKAIKQGGLANPSAAVIDIAKQDHEQYGEISLVMPSSLVDSATGQNAGTYTGDIWSPTYPYIERKMNSKGTDKYYETINKVFENAPVGIKNRIQVIFVNMLDNQGDPDNLAYWYMLEKGIAPTDVIINSGISDDIKQRFEPLRDKHFVSDMNAEERGLLLSLAAELEGKTTEDLLQAAQEAKARYEAVLANEKASGFSKRIATEAIDEIDTYGVRFNLLSETLRKINEAIDKDGGVDVNASIGAAVNYVQENGLKDDFDSWLDNLDNRFGIEEVIFDGYNRNGDRKYIKHTLENASRIMNQQPIQNASSHGGLSATRGQLVERMSTLAQIRANKHRLAVINEYEDEQWKAMQDEWFNKIINPLSNMQQIDSNHFINMDIAEQRLLEAIMKKDPIAHLNREYGYSIAKDSEFAKSLKDLMQRLKELPSKYFETKFKRPVYLNEFVSAVVPQNLPQDLKDGLANAGVELYEYDEAQDGSRREATLQATESDDVRFLIKNNEENLHNSKKNSTFAAEMEKLIESDAVSAQEVKQFIEKVRNGRKEKTLQMGRLRMDGTSRGNDLYWCGAIIGEAVALHQEKAGVSSQSSLLGSNLFIEVAKQLNAFTDYDEFVKGLGVPDAQGQEAIVWSKDDNVVKALHYNALLRHNTQQIPAIIERISWFNHLFPENQLSLNQVLGLHNNNLYVEVTQDYVDGEHPNFEDWDEVGAFINQMKAKGFEATIERGGEIILYKDNFEVRDLVGRNVIKDEDGVFHVIDANISQEVKEKPEIRFSIKDSEYNPTTARTITPESAREMAEIKASAERNGTYLKAPNGADTNLTPRQWLQVRTRAFKEWFGDWENDADNASKIVDENGEPMVVYHGTPRYSRKRFFAFNTNNGAAWFTPAKRYAEVFAESDQDAISTLYETYISMHNPANVGDIDMEVTTDRLNTLAYGLSIPLAELEECVSKVEDVTYLWNLTQSKPFADLLKKYGYDGIQAREAGVNSYGVFTPNQIKSATENVGTFDDSSDDIRFRISNENQRIFVSNAEKAVEGIKQEKATPQQWLAMLEKNGGIKAGEDKWLGLSEWLKEQDKKSITKQEILDFISENQIQIEEVAYSAKPKNEVFEKYKKEFRDYYFEAQDNGAESPQDVAWERMIEEHGEDFGLGFWAFGPELQVEEDSNYTNWEYENETNERPINETRLDYTTEGLENKREIALTVPTIESWNEGDEVHFGDAGEGRSVAWVRFGETIDEDGSKVLVIDEIQSKRHQEGREKGYKASIEKLQSARKAFKDVEYDYLKHIDFIVNKYSDKGEFKLDYGLRDIAPEEAQKYRELQDSYTKLGLEYDKLNYGVPSAPFDKNWHELAMKRMLRYAAENSYDYVAWTTGAQQAERYDIGAVVDNINAGISVMGDRLTDINYRGSNAPTRISHTDDGSIISISGNNSENFAGAKNISDIVGKELSIKILSQTEKGSDKRVEYRDLDLSVGGEGMKGFYDRMLPSFVSKYTKKWGAKVQDINLPNLEESAQTMHAVNVTESMKEDVMAGQPMFRISEEENRTPLTEDKIRSVATDIWNKYQYDGELESTQDIAEYAEENMPKNEQTQALFDAIDKWRDEAEEDRLYYGGRGDLEPFEDAVLDEVEKLMKLIDTPLTEAQQLIFDGLRDVAADAGIDIVEVSDEQARENILADDNVEPSIRTKAAPKKTGIGYKVFFRGKDGKLYPPMVANPNGADTPIGVWLDADAAPVAGESKTGRQQVKAGGKGTQGGSGTLAFRPGWHLGEIPYALQFNRKDETGERTLFPKDFVWAEVEYAKDVDYQAEAESYGYTENGKYRHSYAGLPRVPENGSYRYRTNPNPATDPWIITGAMKVNRVLTNEEVDELVRKAGREPQQREMFVSPITGKILGYAQGGTIYLTKAGMTPETMVHEYTHVWAKAMQRNNRAGWENIKEIFKKSPLWDHVKNDPNYKDRLTTDDAICSEVLARFSGKQGAERLNEVASEFINEEREKGGMLGAARVRQFINHARQAIKSFWKWVGKNLFGITKFDSMEDVADRVLYDLLNATELDVDRSDNTIESSIEMPSAEFRAAMKAWNDANPYPIYMEGESLGAFSDRLTAWKKARDAYRAELWRKSQEKIESADPISEPMVAGSKPVRRKDETPLEYAQRLKQWQNAQIDSQLSEEYTAEMNRLAGRLERAKHALVDAALPIEEWQNWLIEHGATMTSKSNAYQDMFLAQGRVSNAAEELRRDIIQKLTRKIAAIIESKKLDDVDLRWHNMDVPGTKRTINGNKLSVRELIGVYCQAKDCEEAEEKGLPDRGKAGFKNNLDVEYTDIVNAVETRLSREDITELWYLINRATKYALDYDLFSGRISPDTYNEFVNRDYYVPQRGWRERDESGLIEEYEPVGKRGHDPYNAALVKARGRQSLAADPFAYIMSIDHSSIVSSENNKIKQKMLQFCLDNEEIGLKTGAFRVKKYWLMHEIDPDTGKIRKDEDGTPITLMSYTEPKAEDFKHDKKVKDEVKRIEKEIAKRKKALEKELAEHGDTNYAKALQRAIANSEAKIEDLNDTLIIAFGATNTHISQRTRDEKLQHEVQVMKDGQRYVIELQDEKVANAINKKFKQHQEALFNVSDKMRNATRFMSAMLTQYNPEFAASNFVRDFQVAVMTLTNENPKLLPAFLKNFAACQRAVMAYAFADKVKDRTKYVDSDMGAYLREYMASGAPTGFSYMQDLKTLRKDFDSMVNEGKLARGVRSAAGIFSMFTEISETAVRFAAYAAARQAGWAINDAAYMSKELTTNFDRAGEMADSGWMSWFSFMRATINGNVKFFRAFKKLPVAYGITAAVYFAMGIINQFANPNDPEDEVWASDFVRENNFVIGKWRIPAAHFMRIFYSAGVNMASWMQGERTFGHAVYNSSMSAFNEILPNYMNVPGAFTEWSDEMERVTAKDPKAVIRELAPTPISPFVDVWANRNFMGGTINREPFVKTQENTKDILMAKDNTLPIYRAITEGIYTAVGGDLNSKYKSDDNAWTALFDVSGSSLEHITEGYLTGGMDMLATTANMIYDAVQGNELTPDKITFIRKFYNRYTPQKAYDQQYWLLKGRVQEYQRKLNDYKENNPDKYKLETRSKQYKAYEETNELIRKKIESPTTEDVKRLMGANQQWIKASK